MRIAWYVSLINSNTSKSAFKQRDNPYSEWFCSKVVEHTYTFTHIYSFSTHTVPDSNSRQTVHKVERDPSPIELWVTTLAPYFVP